MPRRLTMGTLVTRCKQRCDLENDEHISSAEWKALISEQYGDMWSIRASQFGSAATVVDAAYFEALVTALQWLTLRATFKRTTVSG